MHRPLIHVARVLSAAVRPHDLVARLGGDEFALWLQPADAVAAERQAQRLRAAIKGLSTGEAPDLPPLGASIGICCWTPGTDESAEQLLARADQAMYAAKRAGKEGAA